MDLSTSPTTSTRNPLLQLDLCRCILDHLDPVQDLSPEKAKERHETLVVLAQTCRALSEPALDRLWRKLTSLRPLIQCLSPVWGEDKKNMQLSQADWVAIRRYSHRIKSFIAPSQYDWKTYWLLQATSSQPGLLLPDLRVLLWYPTAPESIEIFQSSLSHSLVRLEFGAKDISDGTVQLLVNLHHLCPHLESIRIWKQRAVGWRVSQAAIKSLSQTFSLLQHIESLSVAVPIDDVALAHIATSPKVKKLDLILHPDDSQLHNFHLLSDTIPFCNVRDLTLQIWNLDLLTSLLRVGGQVCRSLCIELHSRPTIRSLSAFLDTLATPHRAHSLQSLSLYTFSNESGLQPKISCTHDRLSYDALCPLTQLSHLQILATNIDHCLFIDDDELIALAHHWPLLKKFDLRSCCGVHRHVSRSGKHITLNGLVSLVECCPHLQQLVLTLDATVVPTQTGRQIIHNPKLRCLFVDSPIDSPELVAQFLAQHFLSLHHVSASFSRASLHRDVMRYQPLWNRVQAVLLHRTRGQQLEVSPASTLRWPLGLFIGA